VNDLSFSKPALAEALSVVLPTPAETLLLRACLYPSDSARRAWQQWQDCKNDLTDEFLGDNKSVKKLRPLVFNAQNTHGVQLDKESQTYLRSAYLQEDLRSKMVRRICRSVLLLFEREGIQTIVLKGMALAETVYANPVLRHCHDIDLLLKHGDVDRAKKLLPSVGFREIDQNGQRTGGTCKFEHESGLPVELHTALFQLPYYNGSQGKVWERSRKEMIADCPATILAPADNLLHVCCHAFHQSRRESLRWVSDAWFIMDRNRDLDWEIVLEGAHRSHLNLPFSVTLAYLAEELDAPVPPGFLNRLFVAASKSSVMERDLALFSAHSSRRGSLTNLFRSMKSWRGRADMLRWLLLPSPGYLYMVEEARPSCPLPVHYICRLLRYVRCIFHNSPHAIRRIRWRIDRLFLRTNLRTP